MNWQDILKVSEREQLDAEEFASDEMGQWRDDKQKGKEKEEWAELKEWLITLKSLEPHELEKQYHMDKVIERLNNLIKGKDDYIVLSRDKNIRGNIKLLEKVLEKNKEL